VAPCLADFDAALHVITPAAARSSALAKRPLPAAVGCLLDEDVEAIVHRLRALIPDTVFGAHSASLLHAAASSSWSTWSVSRRAESLLSVDAAAQRQHVLDMMQDTRYRMFWPGCVIGSRSGRAGPAGDYVLPAVAHALEPLPVVQCSLADLPTDLPLEVSVHRICREARRAAPCLLSFPRLGALLLHMSASARVSLHAALRDIVADGLPIVFLASVDDGVESQDGSESGEGEALVKTLFGGEISFHAIEAPGNSRRTRFFLEMLQCIWCHPRGKLSEDRTRIVALTQRPLVEELTAVAMPAESGQSHELSAAELKRVEEEDEVNLRELRICLREIVHKLAAERRFRAFLRPIDEEEYEDYYRIIEHPIDLELIENRIDEGSYGDFDSFKHDINLLVENAIQCVVTYLLRESTDILTFSLQV
jgi:hypothetical protein